MVKVYFILETDVLTENVGDYFHENYIVKNWKLPFLPRIGETIWFPVMSEDLEYFKGIPNSEELNEEILDISWEVIDIKYDKDLFFNGKRFVHSKKGETCIYIYVKGT